MTPGTRGWILLIILVAALLLMGARARAFDHGFDKGSPASLYFEGLHRPDYYPGSCCGKADAYEADTYQRNADGTWTVVITDGSAITYPDGTTRPYIATGTVVVVPGEKVNPPDETRHNPTDHAWLFVSVWGAAEVGTVYCFAPMPEGS